MKVTVLRCLICIFVGCVVCAPLVELGAATKRKSSTSSSSSKKKSSSASSKKAPTPAKAKSGIDDSSIPPEPLPERKSSPSASPSPSAAPSPAAGATPTTTTSSLAPEDLSGFSEQSEKVRKLLTSALALTRQNLTYKFYSADPSRGGMDCSGFVYYVLKQNGITDVPRQANEQYAWLRKAGTFRAVLSRKNETFELDELRPGDLLFWVGTYKTQHDPPISHAMIYLGREKSTKARVMVGSSDGRTYHGVRRNGVSVFDFKLDAPKRDNDSDGDGHADTPQPRFVGYAHVPGLRDE